VAELEGQTTTIWKYLNDYEPQGVALLEGLLTFDPHSRITASTALVCGGGVTAFPLPSFPISAFGRPLARGKGTTDADGCLALALLG
jgi:hypothetical protein